MSNNGYDSEGNDIKPSESLPDDSILLLTQDIQRLQADFQNYRRRVDRERLEIQDNTIAKVLLQFLNVLDDIDRAKEHGELEDKGFKAVANQIISATESLGLSKFNNVNVPFDHNIHEALLHEVSADVEERTVVNVLRPGYRFKDKMIRPAQVTVADPISL